MYSTIIAKEEVMKWFDGRAGGGSCSSGDKDYDGDGWGGVELGLYVE